MTRTCRLTLGLRHGLVSQLLGLISFPSPTHITILVVLRLTQTKHVGMQIPFNRRQRIRRGLANESRIHQRGDMLTNRLQNAQHRQISLA